MSAQTNRPQTVPNAAPSAPTRAQEIERQIQGALEAARAAEARLQAIGTLQREEDRALRQALAAYRGQAERLNQSLQAAHRAHAQEKERLQTEQAALVARLARAEEQARHLETLRRDADARLQRHAADAQAQYQALRATAERQLQAARAELDARAQATTHQDQRRQEELRAARQQEAHLAARLKQFEDLAAKTRAELDLYKNSWTQVLEREQRAQAHLAERAELTARLARAEAENRSLESAIAGMRDQLAQVRQEVRAVGTSPEFQEAFENLQRVQAELIETQSEAQETLARLDPSHPGRAQAEETLAALQSQRDQLDAIAIDSAPAP